MLVVRLRRSGPRMSEDILGKAVVADRNAKAAIALAEQVSQQLGEAMIRLAQLEVAQVQTDQRFAPLQGQIARMMGGDATGEVR